MKKKQTHQPNVRSIGQGHDRRTGVRSWVFEVIDRAGKVKHVIAPFGSARSRQNGLLEAIGAAGFPVPFSREESAELFNRLVTTACADHHQVVSTSGWTSQGSFVTPRKVYAPGSTRLINAMAQSTDGQRFRRAGKLADWQREVAGLLRGNNLATFAVAAALASPLQELLGVESGGFQCVGGSSIGKSTILTIAGSVWGGGGRSGFCNTWLSTSNALDDIANAHSNCFLALDETGVAGETRKAGALLVLNAAYRLTGGEEKARKTDQHQRQSWSLLFLGTTEYSLEQLGRIAKEPVAAGQSVRIVDIQADAGVGLGAWDELPESISSSEALSDTLKAAATRLYGTAADHFLKHLVAATKKDKSGLVAWLNARMAEFHTHIDAGQLELEKARIARRFALVYAAGALACKYGTLPWTGDEVLASVTACYHRVMWPKALLNRRTPAQSVALMRSYIQSHHQDFIDLRSAHATITKRKVEAAKGIILQGKHGHAEYLFSPSAWRERVCVGADGQQVRNHLVAAGLLNEQQGGKSTVTRDFPKPAGRVRVISVKAAILDKGDDKDKSGG